MDSDLSKLSDVAEQLKIGSFSRHIFLCIGDACCAQEQGEAAWQALKKELKDRNLSLAEGSAACYRTKADCLRVCMGGPILVVYPEGLWYAGMTADRIPEFIERQIVQGRAIEEWIFARNPLPPQTSSGLSSSAD
jgi:(2Fe-2S) ferredoxin